MSRGFVKESDQEELPIIPPRADLPAGVINYVTEFGYKELRAEYDKLIDERNNLLIADEIENRIAVNFINAKIQLLLSRISTAKVIDLSKQPREIVRFGAEVFFTIDADPQIQNYRIVGVDEANIALRKIALTSPIAKVLLETKVGDVVTLNLGNIEKQFKIVSIKY